jgi:hypothetical protein
VHYGQSASKQFVSVGINSGKKNALCSVIKFAAKLGNEDEDKVSVISDLESILTCYCKSTKTKYEKGNGWIEILLPLLSLKLPRSETYNLLDSILHQYIPRLALTS